MHGHVVRVVLGVIAEEHRTPGVGGRWLEAKWVLALVSARAAGQMASWLLIRHAGSSYTASECVLLL